MILQPIHKQVPRWPTLIRQERRRLKESQSEFAARFGATAPAVSRWENGEREAPYVVTWYLYQQLVTRRKK